MEFKNEIDLEPWKPSELDCCGSGCNPCILDIYEQEKNISKYKSSTANSQLNPENYSSFQIADIIQHTQNTNIYRLKLNENEKLGHSAGQHLIIRQKHPVHDGTSITRQYSILSFPDETQHFDLLIKLYPQGLMSNIIRSWDVGDCIPMRGPFGCINLNQLRNSGKQLLFICQGTGLVPFISIIQHILEDQDCDISLKLLFCVSNAQEILMKDVLYQFCDYWNFHLQLFISSSVENDFRLYGPNKSFVNRKLNINDFDKEMVRESRVLLCGSKDFMKCYQDIIVNLGASFNDVIRL